MHTYRRTLAVGAALAGALTIGCADTGDAGGGGPAGAGTWSMEGRLETIVFEGPQGGTRHYLVPDDGMDALELTFDRGAFAPTAGSGARIGVRGRRDGAGFRVSAFDDEIDVRRGALPGVTPERTRTVAFVMVDYGSGVNVT